jgi:signal recognition particle subunit SRP54
MFSALAEKFQGIFSKFLHGKALTESNIQEAIDEVRLALLDADVQYSVAKTFVQRVKEKAIGQKLISSVSPGQLFVKIVHEELVALLGSEEKEFVMHERPARILLCGLQGSGKTTHAAKIALYLKEKKGFQRPCLVACDLARPAAVEQLATLAKQAGVDCFQIAGEKDPVRVVKEAMYEAPKQMWDVLIFDTAGRLHIDEELMAQLVSVKEAARPHHVVLTLNAATGQDAVKVASAFADQIGVTGSCLTMLDGSARGGAAISVVEVTKRPVLFEGHGEKLQDIRPFHPVSMADRILGMGDTINLVRKAQEHLQEQDAQELERKLRRAEFSYEDFLAQMRMLKKMGSVKGLLAMLPGLPNLPIENGDAELVRAEAIILSMTPLERSGRYELSVDRRRRIAKGSGTTVDDVNRLAKTMKQAKQFFKNAPKMKQLEKMMGGRVWR